MNNRKRAIAVLIAVLLTGCLLGVSGLRFWENKFRGGAITDGGYTGHDYSGRIFDHLQITPEQEKELEKILEDSRREINACRVELQDRMNDIRINTNDRIAAILDEDQKSLFESLTKGSESRGGGGHHGRGRNPTVH